MSVMSWGRGLACRAVLMGCFASSALPGCAAFGAHKPSLVAQGKYYSSGDPHYDEFFIALYLLQVEMADAPKLAEGERRALAEALTAPADADAAGIGQRLHEEAQKLGHAGVHLRLDTHLDTAKPEMASATLRSNARPKDGPTAVLLNQVETSAAHLARSVSEMKEGEEALGRLEPLSVSLDAGVDTAFADTHFGKQGEVRRNLADAQQLIGLMRTRAQAVHATSEQLLAELTKNIDTDDGSLGPAAGGAVIPESEPASKANDASKKPAPKARPANKPAAGAVSAKPAPARPKATAAPAGEAPAAKPPASKAPAASRDFEP